MRAFASSRLTLLALALPLVFAACDTYETRRDVSVVDFRLDALNYDVSADNKTASFETDNVDSGTARDEIEFALRSAGDGALVLLYIESELVQDFEGTGQTFSALPLSRSFEEVVLQASDTSIPVVGYTVSYEYSFDNDDLYFDVVSSAPATDFDADPRVLFDSVVPQRVENGPDQLEFRLVTIPSDRYYGQGAARIDLRDYEAVKRAYNLPD
ncbi:MAG: hypothetical protein Rubg2KO_03340 [Rubricoccaceae bacterium]